MAGQTALVMLYTTPPSSTRVANTSGLLPVEFDQRNAKHRAEDVAGDENRLATDSVGQGPEMTG